MTLLTVNALLAPVLALTTINALVATTIVLVRSKRGAQ